MNIQKVMFWRTEEQKLNSMPEFGIMIEEDKLIIDKTCNPVPVPTWDYKLLPYDLSVNIEL